MRLLAAICACSLALACRERETRPPAAVAPAPSPAAVTASPEPSRLVGRWLRADADYAIDVASVGADGRLEARYSNPNPIHVSRAEWRLDAGALKLLLELQDRNYPGNFYTLTYDPGSDSLSGIYHHLGVNQQFEVAFSRISGGAPARAQ